jgi:MoaA/NifB/PqqE/SkfB family radical SAM enzyme
MTTPTRPSPQLDLLYFKLFDDCNAKCVMCTCWQAPRTRRDPAFYHERLGALLRLRPQSVRFTGGEPLLLPSLPDLIRQVAATGARASVITNGRLLSARVPELAASGCAEVVMSLDGSAHSHDTIRATPGLFQRCVSGINALADNGLSYGINTVIQRGGVTDIPDLAQFLLDNPYRPDWWHMMPIRDYPALSPTPGQLRALRTYLPQLRQLAAAQGVRLVVDEHPVPDNAPAACIVPTFTAYATADTGEMFGCNMLAHRDVAIGRYTEDGPEELWHGSAAAALRERCHAGANTACIGCDNASRTANHTLRELGSIHNSRELEGER